MFTNQGRHGFWNFLMLLSISLCEYKLYAKFKHLKDKLLSQLKIDFSVLSSYGGCVKHDNEWSYTSSPHARAGSIIMTLPLHISPWGGVTRSH